METRYTTLKALYDAVKEEVHPTTYICPLNQVLVRQNAPWDIVLKHLHGLSEENLVTIEHIDTLGVMLTQKGLEKITSLHLIHAL